MSIISFYQRKYRVDYLVDREYRIIGDWVVSLGISYVSPPSLCVKVYYNEPILIPQDMKSYLYYKDKHYTLQNKPEINIIESVDLDISEYTWIKYCSSFIKPISRDERKDFIYKIDNSPNGQMFEVI